METLIAATIVIGDRNYRIKMNQGDEETVRRTVKTINDKILEYKTNFAGKDMQDYIAMVLIWLATEQAQQQQPGLPADWSEQLESIEKAIDNQINI